MKKTGHILIVLLLLLTTYRVSAQSRECSRVWEDTLKLCPGTRALIGSRVVMVTTDTLISGKDIENVYILYDPYSRSRELYDTLRSKASKREITRLAFQLMFPESGRVTQSGLVGPEEESIKEFESFRGKKIRQIVILRSMPFGGRDNETGAWLGALGNSLHLSTREKVIRDHLFIREGEDIDPYRVAENAQFLRALPYFSEVKVRLVDVKDEPEVADMVVWVKDVFPIGLDVAFGTLRLADLTLYNQNFAGSGHLLSATTRLTTAYSPAVTLQNLKYRVPNLGGTFLYADAGYTNHYNHEHFGIGIGREFIESGTRLAGGLSFSHHNQTVNIFSPVFRQDEVRYNQQEIWLGRAFRLNKTGKPLQLALASGLVNKLYTLRPYVSSDTNRLYYNSSTVLFSLSVSQNNYYRGNYIYEFGPTEDIPYGFLGEITIGPEGYEYSSRTYLGMRFSFARYYPALGYFTLRSLFSAYNRNGVFEQGQVAVKAGYFSNLSVYGLYKIRHFADVSYVTGFKRLSGETVNIVNDLEIMLQNTDDTLLFAGTQKLSLKYSAFVYTPYYYLGFRFAFFNFASFAFIGSAVKPPLALRHYSGFGLGCMLRNENLVIRTIKLRLGFYPALPDGRHGIFFEFSGIAPLEFFNYKPRKPSVYQYE